MNLPSDIAHYRLTSKIGEGGMGVVYRATDSKLDREVAVKILPEAFAAAPDRMARFTREAKMLASLNHPNIAAVYGVEDRALIMELVEGPTLAERIQQGPIPWEETLPLIRQIAEALEYAHERGVMHRDLKPANVKITPDGRVKLLDFGLAKALAAEAASGDPADAPTLTRRETEAGVVLGTPLYMSPEQAVGKPVDKRTDIWSFGVVLWETLTGRRLFGGETVGHTLAAVINAPIDFGQLPPTTPAAVGSLLRRCLDRDRKTRLRDIGEARIALEAGLPAPETIPPPGRSRAPVAWVAVSAMFALALGVLAFVHFRESAPDHPRIRVQVALPEGDLGDLGLSPDGKYLNFSLCEAFTCKTWIRPLDSLDAQPLADSGRVFWSPDSRHFVFRSADKVYKMAPTGGPPVFLANAPPDFSTAAWLEGGTIVLATAGGTYSLPESGGVPAKIGGQPASGASWLPGRRFLYSNKDGVFVGSLQGDAPVSLLPDSVVTTYVPPRRAGLSGHLLFVRAGRLLAQEFDSGKLQLHGDPIPVAASASDSGGVQINAVAASRNGVLAFRRGNLRQVVLTWLDRSGRKLQTTGKPFNLAPNPTIRLSPDDSRAIVEVAGPTWSDLWIADFTRDTFSRFTFEGSPGGLWSPDGSRILWADQEFHHYLKAADGSGGSELLYRNPNCANCLIYDWSPDGKLSSFGARIGTKYGIWLAALDGDRRPFPYRQVAFNNFFGMFSPDSRWLAYTSDESGQNQIFIDSIPAGKKRWQVSAEESNWPIWRRDGKELFYRQGSSMIAVPVRPTATTVEIGEAQTLFRVPPGTRFQVSRDGQRFLIALPVDAAPALAPITIDTDWQAGLAK